MPLNKGKGIRKKRKFFRRGDFYVYILECANGAYYTGSTNNLENRVTLHNSGRGAKYTRNCGPVKLIWSKKYRNFKNALLEERRIKTLPRPQKEKLVRFKRPVNSKK